VGKFRASYPDLGKSDWVDAGVVIADRLRFGRLPAECYLDERYPLQRLTRHRKHLIDVLVRGKQVALGYVYLKCSADANDRPLSDVRGDQPGDLEHFLTPDEIVQAPLEDSRSWFA
jgi:hypothetical protein